MEQTYNSVEGIFLIDIRTDDEKLHNQRLAAIVDSLDKTAKRLERKSVILEVVDEKYFPYANLPGYKRNYQSMTMILCNNNVIRLRAIRKWKNGFGWVR